MNNLRYAFRVAPFVDAIIANFDEWTILWPSFKGPFEGSSGFSRATHIFIPFSLWCIKFSFV